MKTELHLRLERLCRRLKNEPRHWFLAKCESMWLPEMHEHVSVKRAIYAAFVGDVPAEMEVKAKCDSRHCVNPEHLALVPARNLNNRPLSFPWHLEQLTAPKRFVPPTPKGKLPVGMSHEIVARVKTMLKAGSTLNQVQLAVDLPVREIVLIKNGMYNRVAGKAKRAVDKQIQESRPRILESVAAHMPETPQNRVIIVDREAIRVEDDQLNIGANSDEQIWLDMMRNK